MWPSRDNLKAIAKYPKPMMYTAIKSFIRRMGHYRCFIKDFTKITDPLHEYARGDTAKKKKEWVVLNEVARSAFHKLKKSVMSAPVLAYPDPNKEYLLKTDASKLGLGLCCPRNNLMRGTIQLPLGAGIYMEQSSITTVQYSSFWP